VRGHRVELAVAQSLRGLEQRLERIARLPPQLIDHPRRDRRPRELGQPRGAVLVAGRLELSGQPLALGHEPVDRDLIQRCDRVVVTHHVHRSSGRPRAVEGASGVRMRD
jgi:hypothetical protein